MKIFVTGSNGFIGSHVVKRALDSGHEIVGLRRSNKLEKISLPRQPIWVEGTLESDIRQAAEGCEAIIPQGEPEIHNLGTGRPMSLKSFAGVQWKKFGATGRLKRGDIPYRKNAVMRYVPLV
jgi:nucleoside-diphosphate-sugar epimerase